MEPQQQAKPPPPNLAAAADAGFNRTINRYLAAWPDSTTAIQAPIAPADTFFVPSTPSEATTCPLCAASFSTNDLLRSHIFAAHPRAYGAAPVLPPLPSPFPAPNSVLPSMLAIPPPTFPGAGIPGPPDAWFPIPPSSLYPMSAQSVPAVLQSANGTPVIKDRALFCQVCEVQCDTPAQLASHQDGQKHRKRSDLYRTFAEASMSFDREGLKQVAPESWNCLCCKTTIQGKNPVMQHLQSVKHVKYRLASAAYEADTKTRSRAASPFVSPTKSTGGGGVDVAGSKTNERTGALRTGVATANEDAMPRVPKPAINPGVINANRQPDIFPSLVQAAGETPSSFCPPSKSLLQRNLPSPSRASPVSDKRTLPSLDRVHSPASTMSSASPNRLPLPNQNNAMNPGVSIRIAKPGTNYPCVLCNITCNSVDSIRAHLAGAKHKRKQVIQEAAQSLNTEAVTPNQAVVDAVLPFRCKVCSVTCCGPESFHAHLEGKLHAKRLRLNASQAKAS